MKKLTLLGCALLALGALSFTGCGKDSDTAETIPTTLEELSYGDFTEQSDDNTAYVLRSNSEYFKYIHSGVQPDVAIPYDGYAIIVARGRTLSGITKTEAELLKKDGKYILKVDVYGNLACVIDKWCVTMRVDDFPKDAKVELKLTTHGTKSYYGE